ncbi:Txe/YoeB family addiction module toxin [Glycomyces paridis]|uniref:Endoribonuclease YoeB n=1 Tax=Glycomyces paridis TaxID=2126555 RepID=A0A4S8PH40_9ACTN|nr:Txe/YoeB family addiction module toxin [Glycomyces paridis]THV27659.1 Txe/YoeB family addiction module toxin [Glycomyces paridis]
MNLVWSEKAWDDYLYWQTHDKKLLKRINLLLEDIKRNGYTGLGKPEPLKHDLGGYWSRRIDAKHRLIYQVSEDHVHIARCRFHYGKPDS